MNAKVILSAINVAGLLYCISEYFFKVRFNKMVDKGVYSDEAVRSSLRNMDICLVFASILIVMATAYFYKLDDSLINTFLFTMMTIINVFTGYVLKLTWDIVRTTDNLTKLEKHQKKIERDD